MQIAIFPPVLGVRQGTLDAVHRLRADGHAAHVVDPFEGRAFDDYEPAMNNAWEQIGQAELLRRALDGTRDLPDEFVAVGFSLGCLLAGYVATERKVSGVVMIAGAIPVSALGEQWPRGVPAQTHSSVGDPWREQEEIDQAVRDVEAAGARIEVYDYPGSGHLFSDPTLPDEYDPASTQLLWDRVLAFVRRLG
ncbi:MAG: dienelactone hydrolase family protein [Candidatus Nanopelagicales bacterium]